MDLNYKVIEEPVFDQAGVKIPNKKMLRRVDNQAVLGIVSDKYKVVQNEDLLRTIPSTFTVTKSVIEHQGAKCRAIFKDESQQFEVDGSVLFPMITYTNGFDGMTRYTFKGGLYRLVCTNGLMVGIEIVKYTNRKHMGNTDNVLEVDFSRINESVEIFKRAAQVPFTLDNARNFVTEKVEEDKISEKTASNIIQLFENKADIKSNTVWGFYNAITDAASNHSKSINFQDRLNLIAVESLELIQKAA